MTRSNPRAGPANVLVQCYSWSKGCTGGTTEILEVNLAVQLARDHVVVSGSRVGAEPSNTLQERG